MKLFEHHAKAILARAGIPVPASEVVESAEEAGDAAARLGLPVVLKAQVLSGGRGKAGGIRKVESTEAARVVAAELLGRPLLGLPVRRLLVEQCVSAALELYMGITVDYAAAQTVWMLGIGGMDVETAALDGGVYQVPVDPVVHLPLFRVREALAQLKLPQAWAAALHGIATRMLTVFDAYSATLVEINPLVMTDAGPIALDARLVVDDSALDDLEEVRNVILAEPEAFPQEHLKLTAGFDYVELDPEGDVALFSTGAGLTLAAVDLIRRGGGRPINFVDLRTGSMGRDPTRLRLTLERAGRSPNLRSVLVNVFAGITNLEEFAHGLIAMVAERPELGQSLVVRATGTGFAGARANWEAHGIRVTESLEEAVAMAVGGGVH